MQQSVWRTVSNGTKIAVLAGCHGRAGVQLPPALLPRLQGADVILTLGDMGDRSALDELEDIAPVLGVRGSDDDLDPRTNRTSLVLEGDGYRIGCVPDAVAAGLALQTHPFIPVPTLENVCCQTFGGPVDMILHAGTRRAEEAILGPRRSALNPGSPVQPAGRERPSFIRLHVGPQGCFGQFVWVA